MYSNLMIGYMKSLGDYESEKKSMQDMFNQLFGDDSDKIAYYFGIEVKEK